MDKDMDEDKDMKPMKITTHTTIATWDKWAKCKAYVAKISARTKNKVFTYG
jgi:hypothetical protein